MRFWLVTGAANGFIGVALGAFAAHFLRERLEPRPFEIWEVAVRYQMYHALALVAVGLLSVRSGGGMVFAQRELSLGVRLWNALDSYGVYLSQTVWPSDLSVFYPHPGEAVSRGRAALVGVLLVAISGAALALARRAPYLLVGWFWYLVTLVPVIGIVQVGMQAHADRYMYLPLEGLAIAAAWGAVDLVGSSQARRRALAAIAALLVLLLAVAAHRQTAIWRDSLTLFGRAVALDPGNLAIDHRLAVALRKAGRLDEAQQRYLDVIQREPRWAAPQLELGALFEERGDLVHALERYQEGLRLDPEHAAGHASRGGDGRIDVRPAGRTRASGP